MENSSEINRVSDIDIMNATEKSTENSKCPSCGANMTFNPENRCLECEHCGTQKKFSMISAQEMSFSKLLVQSKEWSGETTVIQCSNCGAKEVVSKEDISRKCSFCGTTNVIEVNELSGLKPNAVVPFRVGKESACSKVVEWVKRKFFAPTIFKKQVVPENINGIYNPAFTFDTSTVSHYKGVLGRTETYTVRQNGKTVTRTRTVYFNIQGCITHSFDDVLIQAANNISQKDINNMQPFETNQSQQYQNNFLQGFKASQYSKDGKQCWSEAKSIMDSSIRNIILSKYHYTVVQSLDIHTEYSNITYKYVLLPIYVGHCKFKTKLYNFFVNGFTGKVTGKTPLSLFKVAAVAVGSLVVAGAVGFGIYMLSL